MKTETRHVLLAVALCGTLSACGDPSQDDPNNGYSNGNLTGSGNGGASGNGIGSPLGSGNGNGNGNGNGGSGQTLCNAEGTWSDTDGNTYTETALGGGYSVEDAQLDGLKNCNQIVSVSVSTFNGSHVDDNVGAVSDNNCRVTSCQPYVP